MSIIIPEVQLRFRRLLPWHITELQRVSVFLAVWEWYGGATKQPLGLNKQKPHSDGAIYFIKVIFAFLVLPISKTYFLPFHLICRENNQNNNQSLEVINENMKDGARTC